MKHADSPSSPPRSDESAANLESGAITFEVSGVYPYACGLSAELRVSLSEAITQHLKAYGLRDVSVNARDLS